MTRSIDPFGGYAFGRALGEPISDPAPNASFGAIGCFFRVTNVEPKGSIATLSASFEPKKIAHVDANIQYVLTGDVLYPTWQIVYV